MRIGIDFDNTIICYDQIFHKIAFEKGLIHKALPADKSSVRDYLRSQDKEGLWTEMQGYVYGKRLFEADPFPGVINFFKTCSVKSIPIFIISHKTRYPYVGKKYDLHQAAFRWLENKGFFSSDEFNIPISHVFFELSKREKIDRIHSLDCDFFIDDLPEFLIELGNSKNLNRILFDPWGNKKNTDRNLNRSMTWNEIMNYILKEI